MSSDQWKSIGWRGAMRMVVGGNEGDTGIFRALAMRGRLRHVYGMEEAFVIDPAVCSGRPVVRGTRITVQTVMEFLAAGDSVDEVLEAYPSLTHAQVLDCMEWASRLMGNHIGLRVCGSH